jgi:ribosomal protein S18 acetylase RimI-like enzyme
MTTTVRRLAPGDEDVVAALADRAPQTALLADDSTIFLVAFEASEPIGFVLAYELQRRHGDAAMLLVYEVDVHEAYRHRGVATGLLAELARIARERGIVEGFVLTDVDNDAANALYAAAGGVRRDVVEWDFTWGRIVAPS